MKKNSCTVITFCVIIFLGVLTMFSCSTPDDVQPEVINPGETMTIAKAESLKLRSGKNRVELSWILSDSQISSYKVFYNSRKDSIEGKINRKYETDTMRVTIDKLSEGNHFFRVFHYDKQGNRSAHSDISGNVYGLSYQNSLTNTTFIEYYFEGDDLKIRWRDNHHADFAGIELEYTDMKSSVTLKHITNLRDTTALSDFPMNGMFQFRSFFIPEPTAVDTFYTEFQKHVPSSVIPRPHPMDLVLIYTGGAHRPAGWWKSGHFAPYVSLEKNDGAREWLFDGFLFLEIRDGEWSFFGSHGTRPARQQEWKKFADNLFTADTNIFALNDQIGHVLDSRGDSNLERKKIIIAIPEPKDGQRDWGTVKGRALNFNLLNDKIEACKWYVDYVLEKYNELSDQLNYVELIAFYWIKENDPLDVRITQEVSSYVGTKGYDLYWIPNILGLQEINYDWKKPGYDKAYLQPGYFYRTDNDSSRVRQSSELVNSYKLNPYVEFDERTLTQNTNWGYRLDKTIDVFEEYGFWSTRPIGYYQGFNAFYQLSHSAEPKNKTLYLRLADIIAKRQQKIIVKEK